jgi:hypothetical protein
MGRRSTQGTGRSRPSYKPYRRRSREAQPPGYRRVRAASCTPHLGRDDSTVFGRRRRSSLHPCLDRLARRRRSKPSARPPRMHRAGKASRHRRTSWRHPSTLRELRKGERQCRRPRVGEQRPSRPRAGSHRARKVPHPRRGHRTPEALPARTRERLRARRVPFDRGALLRSMTLASPNASDDEPT